MKGLFSADGVVYKLMTVIYRLIVLNLLWFLAGMPLITLGASTTALYYVIGRIVRKEEVHEFRDFFRSFRDNFRQATIIWIILCGAYFIIFTNLSFLERYKSMGGLMLAVQLPMLVLVVIITVFAFPLLSRYESSVMGIIKASWILGIKHIFSCFISLAIIAAAIIMTRILPALLLLVFSSVTASAVYLVLNKVMEKYHPGVV